MFGAATAAKKLLLCIFHCMECKYATEIWWLADDQLKCTKYRKKVGMNYICPKWKGALSEEVENRKFYHTKYKQDRLFFKRLQETEELLDGLKEE